VARAASRPAGRPAPRRLSTAAAEGSPGTAAGPKKIVTPETGKVDPEAWSWKWKAAGAGLVAAVVPYIFKELLIFDWELRQDVESVAPALVEYIRKRDGFPDEDMAARAYTADLEAARAEPVSVEFGPDAQTAASVSSGEGLTGHSKVADLVEALGQKVVDDTHLHFAQDSPRPADADAALSAEGRREGELPDDDENSGVEFSLDTNRAAARAAEDPHFRRANSGACLWDDEQTAAANLAPRSPFEALPVPVPGGDLHRGDARVAAVDDWYGRKVAREVESLEREVRDGSSRRSVDDMTRDLADARRRLREHNKAARANGSWLR